MALDALEAVKKAREFIDQTGKTFFSIDRVERSDNAWTVLVNTWAGVFSVEVNEITGSVVKFVQVGEPKS